MLESDHASAYHPVSKLTPQPGYFVFAPAQKPLLSGNLVTTQRLILCKVAAEVQARLANMTESHRCGTVNTFPYTMSAASTLSTT
jgi:hypothetical protein